MKFEDLLIGERFIAIPYRHQYIQPIAVKLGRTTWRWADETMIRLTDEPWMIEAKLLMYPSVLDTKTVTPQHYCV